MVPSNVSHHFFLFLLLLLLPLFLGIRGKSPHAMHLIPLTRRRLPEEGWVRTLGEQRGEGKDKGQQYVGVDLDQLDIKLMCTT